MSEPGEHGKPGQKAILAAIKNDEGRLTRRALARTLGIKGEDRRELRTALKQMMEAGVIERTDAKTFQSAGHLPPVLVLRIISIDEHGDLIAVPDKKDLPNIIVTGKTDALAIGSRALCKLAKTKSGETQTASVIRALQRGPRTMLGVVTKTKTGLRVRPVQKGSREEYSLPIGAEARDQDIVYFRPIRSERGQRKRSARQTAQIIELAGRANDAGAASLISLYEHGVPMGFSDEEMAEAKSGQLPTLGKHREDLRHLPLVTIDPEDAKDFDDAICAFPNDDGGFTVWVAIADVSAYVRPGSALDRGAQMRGNSVYLPDRVVPMLPESLSADLCSLRPGEDRACMAVQLKFSKDGHVTRFTFHRGLMRSAARLTYEQAQAVFKGGPADDTNLTETLGHVFAAYQCANQGREARAPLDIEIPERRVRVDKSGKVTSIAAKERFDAHKLVEEFMIQANVAAAKALEAKKVELIYRVHEPPEREKVQALCDFLPAVNLKWSMGERVTPKRFNRLLDTARGRDLAETISMVILRTQMKAFYSPKNAGHFGLNLTHYAHFTSPIRRYADLIVHRALISAFGFGDDGLTRAEFSRLKEISDHISDTERRAMAAERAATDRYVSAFLHDKIGAEFDARITGVTRAGLFAELTETGADGFIPISRLGDERFLVDEKTKSLIGAQTGATYKFGRKVRLRLAEAAPINGGLIFEMLSAPERGKPPKRLLAAARNRAPAGRNRGRKHGRRRR